jgi:predicted lipid-binding transport protein (Tim44 family)
MFAAFLVPFLGSLAGKLAMKLIGSVMNSSAEKPAGDAASGTGFKDNFLSLLKAQPASQIQPAAATPGALAATDQANALALGRPSAPAPLPQGFGRQVVSLYVEHQAP